MNTSRILAPVRSFLIALLRYMGMEKIDTEKLPGRLILLGVSVIVGVFPGLIAAGLIRMAIDSSQIQDWIVVIVAMAFGFGLSYLWVASRS